MTSSRGEAIAERLRGRLRAALSLANSDHLNEALKAIDEILHTYDRHGIDPEVDAEIASVLYSKGVLLREMKQPERALAVWSAALTRFGAYRDRSVFDHATRTAFNHAACLRSLGRPEEALQGFEQVVARLSALADPEALEMLGLAGLNHGYLLSELGRHEAALVKYNDVIQRLGRPTESKLMYMLATARGNKVDALDALARHEEAKSIRRLIAIAGAPRTR